RPGPPAGRPAGRRRGGGGRRTGRRDSPGRGGGGAGGRGRRGGGRRGGGRRGGGRRGRRGPIPSGTPGNPRLAPVMATSAGATRPADTTRTPHNAPPPSPP